MVLDNGIHAIIHPELRGFKDPQTFLGPIIAALGVNPVRKGRVLTQLAIMS
jgi:hypothetical protein